MTDPTHDALVSRSRGGRRVFDECCLHDNLPAFASQNKHLVHGFPHMNTLSNTCVSLVCRLMSSEHAQLSHAKVCCSVQVGPLFDEVCTLADLPHLARFEISGHFEPTLTLACNWCGQGLQPAYVL